MKVGIVGAGLAGLVCAYELSKKGVDVVLFESQPYAGGKMRYNIGNINKSVLYKCTNELIDELGLKALYKPQPMLQMGMLMGRRIMMMKYAAFMQRFTPKKVNQYHARLLKYMAGLDFDIFNPSDEVKRLRNISFAEFIKDAPKMEKTFAFSAPQDFFFEDDLTKVAADLGIYTLAHGFDAAKGESYVFEENLMPMALVLEDSIAKRGAKFRFNSAVQRITPKDGKFEVNYTRHDKPQSETVDKIVFTLPLPLLPGVMPELKIESDVVYKPVTIYLTQGELRHPDCLQLVGMQSKDKGNIRIFSTSLEYEHIIVPYDPNKDVDFDILYKRGTCQVIKKQYLKLGWPTRGPGARVPELATNVPGAYICGDFYYYNLMETSIRTAQKVAQMITEKTGDQAK